MNFVFKELSADKLICADVGARGGLQNHWKPFRELIELDAFEPDPVACAEQKNANRANEHWHAVALAATSGTAKLYVLNKASSSSLYPPNPEVMSVYSHSGYGDLKEVVELPVLSFGDFLRQSRRPVPNLIKLDTQGAELDILRSLDASHWPEIMAIQSEVEFVDAYLGQPLFHDLDAYLREQGFILFDLLVTRNYRTQERRENHYLRKHLNISRNRRDISARITAGDAFYIRPPEQIIHSGNRTAILKLYLIFLMYRCLDEALWLAETASGRGTFTPDEEAQMIALVQSSAPKPGIYQRADKIGRWARKLRKLLNIGPRRKIEYWLDRSWDY